MSQSLSAPRHKEWRNLYHRYFDVTFVRFSCKYRLTVTDCRFFNKIPAFLPGNLWKWNILDNDACSLFYVTCLSSRSSRAPSFFQKVTWH